MTTLSFQELTARLEQELFRLHYTEGSILQYRRMWRRIAAFLEHEGLDHFTEEAGMRFLDEQFNFFALEKAGELTQSIINVFRICVGYVHSCAICTRMACIQRSCPKPYRRLRRGNKTEFLPCGQRKTLPAASDCRGIHTVGKNLPLAAQKERDAFVAPHPGQ